MEEIIEVPSVITRERQKYYTHSNSLITRWKKKIPKYEYNEVRNKIEYFLSKNSEEVCRKIVNIWKGQYMVNEMLNPNNLTLLVTKHSKSHQHKFNKNRKTSNIN